MKFLHAADLHIDSPLRGLETYEGAPVDRIRRATRDSFENLVSLAIEEQVDFVVLAGDLFDGKWRDVSTGLWTSQQFRKLDREKIPVYMIRGNHDAASEVRKAITWPDCVREFSVQSPETIVDEKTGVALHGQGFQTREVTDDLSAGYPGYLKDVFNIGVLHTSLAGDPRHDSYAPAKVENLVNKGYDYWALGHIHDRRAIRDEHPFVHFSGNTQGRHVNEPDAKGCLLVSVDDLKVREVAFRATDAVRWRHLQIALRREHNREDMLEEVRVKLEQCHRQSEGRLGAVRVTLTGACEAHRALGSPAAMEEAAAEIRNLANDFDGEIWIEKIRFDTSAPVDLDRLRRGTDLMGDLLRLFDDLMEDEDELRHLAGDLRRLQERNPAEFANAGIDMEDPGALRDWMQKAEGMLVSQLWES